MSANQHPVDMLPANSRRLLCKALVLAGSAAFDANTEKENYWQLVSSPTFFEGRWSTDEMYIRLNIAHTTH
jgi:hypothetical protein